MIDEEKVIKLNGNEYNVTTRTYDDADRKDVLDLYVGWRYYGDKLNRLGERKANLPEAISQIIFCLATNSVKIVKAPNGFSTSFDCYTFKDGGKRIEIKATSIESDLTSFSPKATSDKFYFMDFYRDGSWNGLVDVYDIGMERVVKVKPNKSQTFKEQQNEGRRPRISVKDSIIKPLNLKPEFSINIFGGTKNRQRIVVIKRTNSKRTFSFNC